ncbi:MAG: cysteine--tRNA ligase [Actinobacteria bacterium]|nr:MAG: cysteine--tRNA ligase [Actinomycetota bacterium]
MLIYNTLTRRKEELVPREEGKVFIYACGPTVYNFIHIGNARTFLNFDVIRRYLEFSGYEVIFVQNITDVDDKIINQANAEGVEASEVAAKYTAAFEESMSALRVRPPTMAPKATEHVDGMIEMIGTLIDRGYAYSVDGDVYFEVRKFSDYGKLSGRSLEEMRAGERVDVDPRKRDPMDFALWKSAKPGEPSWESPWGAGRPGWHIECSVMSTKYLGYSFDIHGGAADLIFPHHENEIAQAEAATGKKPFVRIWMHGGLLNVDRQKMAKSLGNFTLLKDVLARYDVNAIRMLMLGTHYRKPLDFSNLALDEAKAKVGRIERSLLDAEWAVREEPVVEAVPDAGDTSLEKAVAGAESAFLGEMNDDFNTAGALGAIFDLVAALNVFIKDHSRTLLPYEAEQIRAAAKAIRELAGVLGLDLGSATEISFAASVEPESESALWKLLDLPEGTKARLEETQFALLKALADEHGVAADGDERLILALLDRRARSRDEKDWSTADHIRQRFAEIGLSLEDTPQGQRVVPRVPG